jgi:tetratricopeptide (TPR) repeat protein
VLLAAALGVPAGGAARGDDAAEVPVSVKMKDGRTLEGLLVSESKEGIVLRMALGDVPVSRADIAEVVKKAPPAAGAPAGAGSGAAAAEEEDESGTEERTTLTLRDGSIVQGRATDLGAEYEVETALGTVKVEKKQVVDVKKELVAKSAPAPAAAEKTDVRDEGLGLMVARPSAAWKFAAEPGDPLARIVMKREDPAVSFRVALAEPLDPAKREVEAASANDMKALLARELGERFRAFRGLTIALDRLHGVPVWRVAYQADTRVFGSKFNYKELRFRFGEADLVLQASAPIEAPAEAAGEMDQALASFAFTGALEAREESFVDRDAGFRLARPRPDWKIAPGLLDPAVPLEVLAPDGAVRCAVEVAPAGGAASAQQAADALERDLAEKSHLFRKTGRTDRSIAGASAVELDYQDFTDGAKPARVRRLLFLRGARLVTLVATEPADGADAAKAPERKAALDALFQSFAPVATESAIGLYRRGARAIELRVAAEKKLEDGKSQPAIQDLTAALEVAPNFGLAYVLRAKAYADSGDEKHALRDFEAASGLLDDPALGRYIAKVQNQQAKALQSEDFAGALRLFRQAIQNDPQNRAFKEDLVRAVVDHARVLTSAGKYEPAIADLKDALAKAAAAPADPRIAQELAKTHLAWAQKVQANGTGDLYRARSIIRKGLKYAPTDAALKSALERIEQDIKKKEDAAPKKKSGK